MVPPVDILGEPPALPPRPGRFTFPLLESIRESPSAMTFRFSTNGTSFQYRSTQAVRLVLPGVDDPWGAARMFSLSSSPSEQGVISVTCRISDTPFKQALAKLRPGATVEVYGPLGMFLLDRSRPSVFIAGGIGITPFRGMLRYALDQGDPLGRRLLYSARVPEELVFRRELDAMATAGPALKVHYTVTRPGESTSAWNGRVGRIDAAWIREAARGLDRPKYYVAGLPEMVQTTIECLRGPLGVPDDDIDYELFHGF